MSEYLKSDCVKPLGCPGVRAVARHETAYTRERADCDNDADKTSLLQEIAEMKIPYCDADDVAHSMRDIARDALSDKCRGES